MPSDRQGPDQICIECIELYDKINETGIKVCCNNCGNSGLSFDYYTLCLAPEIIKIGFNPINGATKSGPTILDDKFPNKKGICPYYKRKWWKFWR